MREELEDGPRAVGEKGWHADPDSDAEQSLRGAKRSTSKRPETAKGRESERADHQSVESDPERV